jgi:hypothetical protein
LFIHHAGISEWSLWGEHSIAVARAGVLAQELDTVNPSSEERERTDMKKLQGGADYIYPTIPNSEDGAIEIEFPESGREL